jgi:hypothetical protein
MATAENRQSWAPPTSAVERRSLVFIEAGFQALDFDDSIRINVTLGDLEDQLHNMEAYGDYHGASRAPTGQSLALKRKESYASRVPLTS